MVSSSFLALFLHFLGPSYGAQVFYDLKDLEVLEREKNFEEFLLHVNDIRPSERDKHWREMYQTMAMGLVDYKIKTKDFSLASYRQIEQIGRSSAMMKDEFFQLKRSIYNKKYFSECFKKVGFITDPLKKSLEKNQCETELSSFWYFSKKDADLGLDLAAILEQNESSVKLWPFYSPAVNDSIANFYCQKPAVQTAVLKKLYEESFSTEFDGNYKTMVDRVLPAKCFNEIAVPLKEVLTSTKTSGLDKEMAMNILEAKGKLSQKEIELYSILYLLDGPVVGDKMNLAWKRVEALNDSAKKREEIMEEIKKLPLVPDKIFRDPNLPRNKAIINLFAKNFPEYLNYYGSSCIKYITNASDDLNVGSSFQCNEFLKAAEATKKGDSPWISDSVQSQYSSIKR
jgi:hypothetical protein